MKPTNYDPIYEKIIEKIHIYSRLCMFVYVGVCSTSDARQTNYVKQSHRTVQGGSMHYESVTVRGSTFWENCRGSTKVVGVIMYFLILFFMKWVIAGQVH